MKKLILFLLPLFALAQNPTNFPYGIKNAVAPSNSTPTYFVTQEVDGVHKKTPATLIAKTTDLDLKQTVFTGICQKQFLTENDIVIDNNALTLTIATVKNGTTISAINPVRFFTDGSGVAVVHEKTAPVVFNFTNTTGVWYFYFNSSGTPVASQTVWNDYSNTTSVYRFYWNATLGVADRRVIESVEYHKNDISWSDHTWKNLQGAQWASGLTVSSNAITSGTPNVNGSNAVITLSSGTIVDDNLFYTLTNAATGSVKFTQNLGTGLLPATSGKFITISNDAGGLLQKIPATDFPFLWNAGTNSPEYLTVNGTRTAVGNNNFFVYYVYALQDPRYGETIKIKSAETDFVNSTLAAAHSWEQLQALFPTLRDGEIRLLYKLTFEYRSTYDVGTKKAALRIVDDLRKQKTTSTAVASGVVPATSVIVSPVGGIASTNAQSALQELDSEKENVANKSNVAVIDGTGAKYYTADYINSKLATDYAKIVYVNATSPNTATIFDLNNPPITNDNLLKNDVNNLYIGNDASSWVYNGIVYMTKSIPSSSNFFFNGTTTDAGSDKVSAITRTGEIQTDNFLKTKKAIVINKDGSNTELSGGYFAFYNNGITNGNAFQLNASNGIDLWNFSSSVWNKRFTFSSDGELYLGNKKFMSDYSWGGNDNNVWLGGAINSTVTGVAVYEGNGIIAIGTGALGNNTTGNNNTAIGINSLGNNTSGEFNFAIGSNSLSLGNGSYNVAMGVSSMMKINGSSNTSAGLLSGSNLLVGSNNLILGANSANSTSVGNLTSSVNGVFLGSEAKTLGDASVNEIVIGYGAVGNGNNSVTLGNVNTVKTVLVGNLTLSTTPTTSAGSYDILTRNPVTKEVEKITTANFVTDAIVNGVTTIAPSQNAVFDALAGKASLSGANFTSQIDFSGGARFPAGASIHFNTGDSGLFDDVQGNSFTTNYPSVGWTSNTNIKATFFKTTVYTVATLPTGSVSTGSFATVSDATAPTYLGTLTGGGSVVCPVFYNGTAWVSH